MTGYRWSCVLLVWLGCGNLSDEALDDVLIWNVFDMRTGAQLISEHEWGATACGPTGPVDIPIPGD
jgi:hypothetical protein